MECYRARELIQEKLEGELDANLQHELKAHLIECHACRDFEQGIEALDSLLSREQVEPVPEGFAARIAEAASQRHRKVLATERRNFRIAAAVVAAALVLVALLPFFVAIPETAELSEKLASAVPELPDTTGLTGKLAEIAPPVPESAPTLADAALSIQSSWQSLSDFEIPALGLSGTIALLLGVLAAAAVAFEAVYLALPYRRRT